jgi:hypothetical protein
MKHGAIWTASPYASDAMSVTTFYELCGSCRQEQRNQPGRSLVFLPTAPPLSSYLVGLELFEVVTMKNADLLDVTPCGSCKNRSFGGIYRLHHQGDKNWSARKNISSSKHPKHAVKNVLKMTQLPRRRNSSKR